MSQIPDIALSIKAVSSREVLKYCISVWLHLQSTTFQVLFKLDDRLKENRSRADCSDCFCPFLNCSLKQKEWDQADWVPSISGVRMGSIPPKAHGCCSLENIPKSGVIKNWQGVAWILGRQPRNIDNVISIFNVSRWKNWWV